MLMNVCKRIPGQVLKKQSHISPKLFSTNPCNDLIACSIPSKQSFPEPCRYHFQVKFTVTVSDRPGGIAELARTLCNLGVSIKDMMHERAWIKSDIFSVQVIFLTFKTMD